MTSADTYAESLSCQKYMKAGARQTYDGQTNLRWPTWRDCGSVRGINRRVLQNQLMSNGSFLGYSSSKDYYSGRTYAQLIGGSNLPEQYYEL